VIATDKSSGLAVYDPRATGSSSFPAAGDSVDLRRTSRSADSSDAGRFGDRSSNSLRIYGFDTSTARYRTSLCTITFGFDIYGSCLYRSPTTGEFYFMGTSKTGAFEQWRLFDDGSGRVDATRVRTFDVGGQCEGCVADDETGFLFIGEEAQGVWRYGAEPTQGSCASAWMAEQQQRRRTSRPVDLLHLRRRGYLIVSSPGDNVLGLPAPGAAPARAQLPDRQARQDRRRPTATASVMNMGMGSAFPDGLFVAQDGSNTGGSQNFQFLSWRDIASAASHSWSWTTATTRGSPPARPGLVRLPQRIEPAHPRRRARRGGLDGEPTSTARGTRAPAERSCSRSHCRPAAAAAGAPRQSGGTVPVRPFRNHLGGTAQFS
jgi:3-phytase